jgi:hypothetical protein
MKTNKHFLWLPVMAALLLCTSCSSDDAETSVPTAPAAPEGTIIHYVATVGDDGVTRATLNSSKQYEFESGDQLVITGTNISGTLTIQAGDVGKTTGATFEGDLTYTGSGTPADDLELQAVLVSTSDAMTSLTYASATYPTTAIASTLAEAVQKYSHLTATTTYAAKSFLLQQQTAFLNFTVTLTDGTTASTALDITIKNGGSAVRTGSVTTVDDSGIKAKFVAAMAPGTTMSSATFQLGTKSAVSFGGTTTLAANKIYNISKTISSLLPGVTSSDVGKVIAANGQMYVDADAASTAGTTAVAIIAYVGSAGSVDASSTTYKGLAIALTDANSGSTCAWYTTNGTCVSQNSDIATAITYKNGIESTNTLTNGHSSHTHAAATAAKNFSAARPTGASAWFLPSMGQWNLIVQGLATKKTGSAVTTNLTTSSNSTYNASNLNTVITDAGGTGFQSSLYWSSTERSTTQAWNVRFDNGRADVSAKTGLYYVRAVFAF